MKTKYSSSSSSTVVTCPVIVYAWPMIQVLGTRPRPSPSNKTNPINKWKNTTPSAETPQ